MAKKKKNTGKENPEPVTNRDQSEEVVANSSQSEAAKPSGDHLTLEVANCDIKNVDIESLIRTIRGQKVMVDFDLAMLYGVKNKRLNQ